MTVNEITHRNRLRRSTRSAMLLNEFLLLATPEAVPALAADSSGPGNVSAASRWCALSPSPSASPTMKLTGWCSVMAASATSTGSGERERDSQSALRRPLRRPRLRRRAMPSTRSTPLRAPRSAPKLRLNRGGAGSRPLCPFDDALNNTQCF